MPARPTACSSTSGASSPTSWSPTTRSPWGGGPQPRLEFVCGPLAGQTIPLTTEVTTLGSVAGNNIVLSDPAVSRKHIGIRWTGQAFELADLGSTNGVY